MALLGSLQAYGPSGSWEVKYGDEAAGTFERQSFTVTEHGTSAKAKKAARAWQKSKQPKWNKIIADRAKALEEKYDSIIKEMSADEKIPNKPFNKLNKSQKSLVKSTLWQKKKFPEGTTKYSDLVIGGETFRVPTSLLKQAAAKNYENAIKLLQKWKKNPTEENLAKLTLKADRGTTEALRKFKRYLKGQPVEYQRKAGAYRTGAQLTKLVESFNLKKFLGDNADTFKDTNLPRIQALKQLKRIEKSSSILTRGTNDYEPLIKIINKYKWNDGLNDTQNRDLIRDSLKNNQVIIDRFKRMGVPLTHNTLTRRIINAHKTILNDAFKDTISPSLKNLSEGQQQTFLKSAQNYFPQVNRAISQTILETLKGDDLKAAKTKLKHYGKLRSFLTKELGATGGTLSKGFLQFDHPLSLTTLKKTGNVAASLNVNPIQGDLNIWKRELDLRLNALTKIDEKTGKLKPKNIEPLRALNNVNKVLFGKLGGDFSVTDEGVKIKSFGADPFLKANLIKGLKKNIGLNGELIKSFDLLSKQDPNIWDQIGIKDKNVFRQRLGETVDIDVDAFKTGILKWTKENPKWTKILEGRAGCLSSGGRVGLAAGTGPSDCLKNKIRNEPGLIMKAFRSLPKRGRIGAVVAGLGAVGAGK